MFGHDLASYLGDVALANGYVSKWVCVKRGQVVQLPQEPPALHAAGAHGTVPSQYRAVPFPAGRWAVGASASIPWRFWYGYAMFSLIIT